MPHWDRFTTCATLLSQVQHLYGVGEFENCRPWMNNMFTCMRAKLLAAKDPAAAQAMMQAQIYVPTLVHEPIWEFKEKPGWT